MLNQLILFRLYLILLLIDIKPKKHVIKKLNFFLPSLKFVPDLFATRKIIKNMMMIYYRWRYNLWLWRFHKYVTFFSNKIDIFSVDINNINNNMIIIINNMVILIMMILKLSFMYDVWIAIIWCMDCHNRFKERKHFGKKEIW